MHIAVDRAWAAGLFEGEGCFQKSGYTPTASLQMTDEDVVRRFAEIMGFGRVGGPYRNGLRKDSWKWTAHGLENFQSTVAMFSSHLGVRRTARAKEIIEWAESRPGKGWRGDSQGHRKSAEARWA